MAPAIRMRSSCLESPARAINKHNCARNRLPPPAERGRMSALKSSAPVVKEACKYSSTPDKSLETRSFICAFVRILIPLPPIILR